MKKIANLIIVLIIFSFITAGTDGTIRGKVVEKDNNPLPGAQIYIKDLGIGTMADIDGNYILLNVEVGTYEVTASMIGYSSKTITGVNVLMDQTYWLNFDMDVDLDNTVDPLELGWQLWEGGRLIHWICNDVPSPFYIYDYNCELSGNIPDNINQLTSIMKLNLQHNNLEGIIPSSICNLNVSKTNDYWFKINYNYFCPPYPDCIQIWNTNQKQSKCD